MSDTDRLAALLCDLFPTAERSRWPFSVQLAAERLVTAGVTLAPTPPDALPVDMSDYMAGYRQAQSDAPSDPAVVCWWGEDPAAPLREAAQAVVDAWIWAGDEPLNPDLIDALGAALAPEETT